MKQRNSIDNQISKEVEATISRFFSDFENEIETVLTMTRDLETTVFKKDITIVELKFLEEIYSLVAKKESDKFYAEQIGEWKRNKLTKNNNLVEEMDARLKFFQDFKQSVREILKFHIDYKKYIQDITVTETPQYHEPSFMPMFEDLVNEGLDVSKYQLKTLMPAMQRPNILDRKTFDRIKKLYTEEIKLDLVWKEQIAQWRNQLTTKPQLEYLDKIEKKIRELNHLHTGILFMCEIIRNDGNTKIRNMAEQLYRLERRIDYFNKGPKAKEPVQEKQEYFYIIHDRQNNQSSIPDFVFPTFRHLYDMMKILENTGSQPGRIKIDGDFFVSRQPYLEKFFRQQEASLETFKELFDSSGKRPSSQLSESQLKGMEGVFDR